VDIESDVGGNGVVCRWLVQPGAVEEVDAVVLDVVEDDSERLVELVDVEPVAELLLQRLRQSPAADFPVLDQLVEDGDAMRVLGVPDGEQLGVFVLGAVVLLANAVLVLLALAGHDSDLVVG